MSSTEALMATDVTRYVQYICFFEPSARKVQHSCGTKGNVVGAPDTALCAPCHGESCTSCASHICKAGAECRLRAQWDDCYKTEMQSALAPPALTDPCSRGSFSSCSLHVTEATHEVSTISVYRLHQMLLFSGVKAYRVHNAVCEVLLQLLQRGMCEETNGKSAGCAMCPQLNDHPACPSTRLHDDGDGMSGDKDASSHGDDACGLRSALQSMVWLLQRSESSPSRQPNKHNSGRDYSWLSSAHPLEARDVRALCMHCRTNSTGCTNYRSSSSRDAGNTHGTDAHNVDRCPDTWSTLPATYPERAIVVARHVFDSVVSGMLRRTLRGRMLTRHVALRWYTATRAVLYAEPFIILCGGTSGSGKSTLVTLLASQLGNYRVLSTDSVRLTLRDRASPALHPELFYSTYDSIRTHANATTKTDDGTGVADHPCCQQPGKRTESPSAHSPPSSSSSSSSAAAAAAPSRVGANGQKAPHEHTEQLLTNYIRQCVTVLKAVDKVVNRCLARRQSIVIEGVHLLPSYMAATRARLAGSSCTSITGSMSNGLAAYTEEISAMDRSAVCETAERNGKSRGCGAHERVGCMSTVLYIKEEDHHRERFATRAKSISINPRHNRYTAFFDHIRTIQSYLQAAADQCGVTSYNNANVDETYTLLHRDLLNVLETMRSDEFSHGDE